MHDIAIAYRIYPGLTKTPPIFDGDKFALSQLCLKSMVRGLKTLNPFVWVLFDGCDKNYIDLFKEELSGIDHEFIELPGVGNVATFKMQMDILLKQDKSENVYFAEDDYFYLENAFPIMLRAIGSPDLDFITPFDHPEYYSRDLHSSNVPKVQVISETKWQSHLATTMTFMTTKAKLEECKSTLYTYAYRNFDTSMWLALTSRKLVNPAYVLSLFFKNTYYMKVFLKGWLFTPVRSWLGERFELYAPRPSLAQHMEDQTMSDLIDWDAEFRKLA